MSAPKLVPPAIKTIQLLTPPKKNILAGAGPVVGDSTPSVLFPFRRHAVFGTSLHDPPPGLVAGLVFEGRDPSDFEHHAVRRTLSHELEPREVRPPSGRHTGIRLPLIVN